MQGFVKGEEFCWSYNLSLSNQITHTDNVNQSEASKIEFSVYESKWSITACLLTFCNQLGALKSELVRFLSVNETKWRCQVTKRKHCLSFYKSLYKIMIHEFRMQTPFPWPGGKWRLAPFVDWIPTRCLKSDSCNRSSWNHQYVMLKA